MAQQESIQFILQKSLHPSGYQLVIMQVQPGRELHNRPTGGGGVERGGSITFENYNWSSRSFSYVHMVICSNVHMFICSMFICSNVHMFICSYVHLFYCTCNKITLFPSCSTRPVCVQIYCTSVLYTVLLENGNIKTY